MSTSQPPDDAPPSYAAATGGASTPPRLSMEGPSTRAERNGIPAERRRSMEDEARPLPPGWVRQFDPVEQHQFFVDTNADPPRSIWVHPYDDPEFLSTLSPEERRKHSRLHRSVTLDDLAAEDTDDEDQTPNLPPRENKEAQPRGIHKYGRKMKDKLTSTTHEQREQQRRKRAEQERKAYLEHMRARQAMVRALETGEPQLIGRDAAGRDLYLVPPSGRGVPQGAYGFNPYQRGPYAMPGNARYLRPQIPYGYGRRMGYGYGGGFGAPLAMGALGGALMGGVLF